MTQQVQVFLVRLLLAAALALQCTGYAVNSDTMVINIGSRVLHTVDERFVSFTMDTAGLSTAFASGDLEAADVVALAKAVSPAYIRLSGGAADSLGYRASGECEEGMQARTPGHCDGANCGNCDAANAPGGAPAAAIDPPTSWFNLSAWRRINAFAAAAGLEVIYGLNSRARARTDTAWDGRAGMASLVDWTAAQPPSQFPVVGYELGNEPDLFCRSNTSIPPAVMAADVIALRARLDRVVRAHARHSRYLLLGPDTATIGSHISNSTTGNPGAVYQFYFSQWAANVSDMTVRRGLRAPVDEITFHQYYFKGPTANRSGEQFYDVSILDTLLPKIDIAVGHANASVHGAALGETASAYDGGAPGLSNSYAAVLGWVDKLGLSARAGLRRVMHQQLCCDGNGYNLLQGRGHVPTPGYWATLLWKRLMGGRVLGVVGDEAPGRTLRAYAHCARGDGGSGGVALALVNVAREPANVDLRVAARAVATDGAQTSQRRELYQLSTVEGTFTGHRTSLNGHELLMNGSALPVLEPVVHQNASAPLLMPGLTVTFVVLPNERLHGCDELG